MITYRKVEKTELAEDFLTKFLKDVALVEQLDEVTIKKIVLELNDTINNGGAVFGAFKGNELLGFASVEDDRLGNNQQYAYIHQLQVRHDYRNKGIGRILFIFCCQFAKSFGASKLYVTALSTEELQGTEYQL